MLAVVQRVTEADVSIDKEKIGSINKGLVILLGVGKKDTKEDAAYLADKIVNLRIFSGNDKNMNLSGLDIGAELLVISQFTLYGECRKGKRPDFTRAARADDARLLYNEFISKLKEYPLKVETGKFAAMMNLRIHNDGPVTLIIKTKKEEGGVGNG